MARGWESKEVESQIESAAEARRAAATAPAELSPEQKARVRELESLQMSRIRVAADLGNAKHPQHRSMLEAALRHLDDKIAALTTAG